VSKRGERRDIFSHLNAYDVFFVFLEEGRHRKGDGGWLVYGKWHNLSPYHVSPPPGCIRVEERGS